MNLDAAAPQDLEAERAVLGAVLLSEAALPAVLEEGLRPEDFYREQHGVVFEAMLRMRRDGEPIDTLTLRDRLRRDQALARIGGQAEIDVLAGATPNVGNHRAYARLVVRAAMWRERRLLLLSGLEAVGGLAEPDFRAVLGSIRACELRFRPLLERSEADR